MEVVKEKKNKRNKLVEVVPLEQPYVIFLDPCGVCNFKCDFCPVNNSIENISERHVIMDMDMFDKIVSDLEMFPNPIKVIELYAFGEPLLNKSISYMVKRLKECEKVEKVRITTNGSKLNRKLSEELVDAGLDYIKISLESLHIEDYKHNCKTDILWDEFVDNIRYLYDYAVKMGGRTEVGIKIFSNVLRKGDKELFLKCFSPISNYTWIETAFEQWSDFDGFKYPNDNKVNDEFTDRFEGREVCSFPFTHMLICSNGDIGLCCYDWNHKTKYTNVKNSSLMEAWNSKELYDIRMKMLRNKRKELPLCSECRNRGYDNIDNDTKEIVNRLRRTK